MARDLLKPVAERNYSSVSEQGKSVDRGVEAHLPPRQASRDISRNGVEVREEFKKYFCSERGEIEVQWEKAANNDF